MHLRGQLRCIMTQFSVRRALKVSADQLAESAYMLSNGQGKGGQPKKDL